MIDNKSLSAGDYDNSIAWKNQSLTYKEWIKGLGKNFKAKIEFHKDYSSQEKNKMVDHFLKCNVQFFLRKYIGVNGNYPFHMNQVRKSLMGCFHTITMARNRTQKEIDKILRLQDCMNRMYVHSHFYNAEGID